MPQSLFLKRLTIDLARIRLPKLALDYNLGFPIGFLPTTRGGLLDDSLAVPQVCKNLFSPLTSQPSTHNYPLSAILVFFAVQQFEVGAGSGDPAYRVDG